MWTQSVECRVLFNSLTYFLFLPIVFLIYWAIGYARINDSLKLRLQNAFVVVASYVFYGWWDWRFLILIAFTSLCSYASGLLINKSLTQPSLKGRSKLWLWLNIIINLGILGVFKYHDFFVSEFGALFGVNTESLLLRVILPVGISFYTFQALSYSIDVYRGNIKPTKDIIAFFAYISFFPQLVAGPIERATNLLPQFLQNRKFGYDQGVDGMRQILWGLFKKIVIADSCAVCVNQVWADYANQSGSTLLLASVLFTFQIYGDFSGYSDIAIGTAKLFGIKLMRNFNNPYFSRDIAEFWRRWHISLTSWFRDYVYIPLGGSRPDLKTKTQINTACAAININKEGNQKRGDSACCGQYGLSVSAQSAIVSELPLRPNHIPSDSASTSAASSPYKNVDSINLEKNGKNGHVDERLSMLITIRNTFVVFMLCAIWHGANWTYMLWGLYHVALFLPLIIMGKNRKSREESRESRVKRISLMLLTFALVTIGLIIFRAPTVADAWGYVSTICTAGWSQTGMNYTIWMALALIGVMQGFEWHYRNTDIVPLPRNIWISYTLIALIWWFAGHHTTDFIYFQF